MGSGSVSRSGSVSESGYGAGSGSGCSASVFCSSSSSIFGFSVCRLVTRSQNLSHKKKKKKRKREKKKKKEDHTSQDQQSFLVPTIFAVVSENFVDLLVICSRQLLFEDDGESELCEELLVLHQKLNNTSCAYLRLEKYRIEGREGKGGWKKMTVPGYKLSSIS